MAYFANSCDGDNFYDLCEVLCPIGRAGQACPVRTAHSVYNYDQCSNEGLAGALTLLVSREHGAFGYPTCHMLEAMRRAIWLVEQECAHITALRVKDRAEREALTDG